MKGDTEHRLTALETNIVNIADTASEIKEYIGKLFSETGDIKTGLALVVQNQNGAKDYQNDCTMDRADISERLSRIETFQKSQIKVAASAGGLMAFLAYGGSKFVEKIAELFS